MVVPFSIGDSPCRTVAKCFYVPLGLFAGAKFSINTGVITLDETFKNAQYADMLAEIGARAHGFI